MDLDKIGETARSSADSGFIRWEDKEVKILDNFHGVRFLDDLWRGGMATFSTSSFGYDPSGRWQVFSFLIDLGNLLRYLDPGFDPWGQFMVSCVHVCPSIP